MRLTAVALATAFALAGCADNLNTGPTGSSELITRATFHGAWPFTVDHGYLGCDPAHGDPGAIFLNVNGTLYGVNGFATPPTYRDLKPIWRRDRQLIADGLPDARVSVGDALRGQRLRHPADVPRSQADLAT